MQNQKCVFRNFALPMATFDHLKQFQRQYGQQHHIKLTNSQALAIVLAQHKVQNEVAA
ncbi:hypothetical protein [Dechloromonas sp. CZR5]|uniref:hypothetical protein n=1 Tax=Dechloromonas sp. CZR5 TaxID=2608630 RepID=UPI00168BE9FF|nr:hypothetical protein [Dechloromonas sp. CZR5]